eukprot:1166195-Amorphochlora_amoeboformis.AAC.1
MLVSGTLSVQGLFIRFVAVAPVQCHPCRLQAVLWTFLPPLTNLLPEGEVRNEVKIPQPLACRRVRDVTLGQALARLCHVGYDCPIVVHGLACRHHGVVHNLQHEYVKTISIQQHTRKNSVQSIHTGIRSTITCSVRGHRYFFGTGDSGGDVPVCAVGCSLSIASWGGS